MRSNKSLKKFVYFIVYLLVLAAGGIFLSRNVEKARFSFLNLEKGQSDWHHLDYRLSFAIANPTNYSDSVTAKFTDARVKGNLFTKILDVQDDNAFIALQLSDVDCSSELAQNPNCAEVYQTPFIVNLSKTGNIKEYIFPNSISEAEEKKLVGLIDPIKVTAQFQTNISIDTSDQDSLGTSLVRYSYNKRENAIEKQKLDYLSFKNSDGYVDEASIEQSQFQLTASDSRAWFKNFTGKENLILKQHGKKQIEYKIEVNYIKIDSPATSPAWTNESLENIKTSFLFDKKRNISRKEEYQTAALRAEDAQNGSYFTDKVSKLSCDISPGERIQILSSMAEHVRMLPEETLEITNLILDKNLSDAVRGDLFYVLQSAATAESQNALLNLSDESELTVEDQKRAITALGFMPLEPKSIDRLWELSSMEESTAIKERAQVALFSLGTSSDFISETRPEDAAAIVQKLEAHLDNSFERNDDIKSEELLLALGNSRSSKAAEKIATFLQVPSDKVRTAAVRALEVSEKEDYKAQLSLQLLDEESNDTKSAIIDSLLKFEPTEETLALAMQSFVEETEVNLRLKLARYFIAASKKYPDSRKAISKLMKLETQPQVYELLARASVGSK